MNIVEHKTKNPLYETGRALKSITKNARAMVLLEPLFGIPNTMYTGYLTLYMLALGLTKAQVGIVTSCGMIANFFFASMSAYAADKMGRRKTVFIFDTISWVIAQFCWIIADNMLLFILAYTVNATVQIVANSFVCLMIEDNEPKERVHVYNFMQISGIVAGFFTPIGTILINRLTLVPAVKVMLIIGIVTITIQIIIRHLLTRETSVGVQKKKEMKDVKIWQIFKAYIPIFKRIIKNKLLILILFIRVFNNIQLSIRNTYLAVLVTERLGFKPGSMALFYTLNSVVILFVLLFVTPILSKITKMWPIALGIGIHIAATILLLVSPPTENYVLLVLAAILIALGTGLTTPYVDALAANAVKDDDRAASNSVMAMVIMLFSTPFGYIGGLLANLDPRAPFLMTLVFFVLCLFLLGAIVKKQRKESEIE